MFYGTLAFNQDISLWQMNTVIIKIISPLLTIKKIKIVKTFKLKL